MGVIRPVVFAYFGWAGDRNSWGKIGLPMSGVGAGTSLLDGLVRFDVARGINPGRQWRVDTYIEACERAAYSDQQGRTRPGSGGRRASD